MFHIDMLSIIMMSLVSFIGIVVVVFSRRYMRGDSLYNQFFLKIASLLLSVALMTVADNLVLFLSAWICCNLTLSQLIIHKSSWKAAKASGTIALQNFILGFGLIGSAFFMLYLATGSMSIQYIVHHSSNSWVTVIALVMLMVGAMTQSAIWPFHKWLTSSMNSPTPVSALMHAGIINGGGFLLLRFAPLYFSAPKLLNIIFVVGLISALLGSFWKLMQHDVKRMLACSTMGQMGFMFVQLGLGLFASALAHLCWHGMFKAWLFLASGRAAQEKRLGLDYPPSGRRFFLALGCGVLGSYIFSKISHYDWIPIDSSLIVVAIVFIASTQLALTVLRNASFKRIPLAMMMTGLLATLYGVNVYFFDLILLPLHLMQPQPLSILHIIGLILLFLPWLGIVFAKSSPYTAQLPSWVLRLYVKALNSSQPHHSTVTSYRKGYDYV
jgi:NAD(P)H-quinone oxidoreductase subunit 5